MENKGVNALTIFVQEGFELIHEIKESKNDDGKIRLFEWIGIVKESTDVLNAVRDLKGIDLSDATDSDIANLANLIMDSIQREVKFTRNDVIDLLNIAKSVVSITTRKRK